MATRLLMLDKALDVPRIVALDSEVDGDHFRKGSRAEAAAAGGGCATEVK